MTGTSSQAEVVQFCLSPPVQFCLSPDKATSNRNNPMESPAAWTPKDRLRSDSTLFGDPKVLIYARKYFSLGVCTLELIDRVVISCNIIAGEIIHPCTNSASPAPRVISQCAFFITLTFFMIEYMKQ